MAAIKNPTTPVTQLVNEVLDQFTKQITDRVFLMIQNDKNLFRKYDALSAADKATFAKQLGKQIELHYGLSNLPPVVSATSVLIDNYTQHKK